MGKIRLSIAQKMIVSLGLLVTLSFGILVSAHLIKVYRLNLRESELLAQTQSMTYIEPLSRALDQSIDAIGKLEATMSQMRKDRKQNREFIVEMLQETLLDNPQLLGVYTLWEPGAFDGKDEQYRNRSSYDDGTGRFLPYAVRVNGNIQLHALEHYEDPVKGSYYQTPKRTKAFSLIEPYSYPIGGEEVMLTSLVLPIVDEQGRFLGIVGADIAMDDVQEQIEAIRPLGGFANMISAEGRYIASGSDPKLLLQPYRSRSVDAEPLLWTSDVPQLLYTPNDGGRGTVLRMFYPIEINGVIWHIETVVPKSNMLDAFYKSLKESVIIMAAALLFMTLAIGLLVRRIILVNIHKVVQATSDVAMGRDNYKLDIRTNDEFEFMAKHFNNMLDQRKEAELLIEYQSTHDLLTGLPNRYAYQLHLQGRQASGHSLSGSLALLFIDLDRFKMINETMDHAMGDQLLRKVSEQIVLTVAGKGRVFRFGSDEFIVLLEDVSHLHQAHYMAEEILSAIADPIRMNDRIFYITASIGMSVHHELTPGTGDRLVKESDIAMYVAKKERNTCKLYTPSMNDVPKKELILENSMLRALESGQFMLYYQPKIDVRTGGINGAEALIRWKHPELGMVSPLDFIPIAEKTGFIIPLGEWVLFSACQQIREWERMGLPRLTVSVNMSMIQFQQKQIVHTIERIIADAGIRPEQIELEITESIFMDNQEHTLRILHELQQLGVKLSLDDFGTGYSSLSYLQNIPIHTLKLDKTFINDIASDYKKQMIFKSVVVIAHHLNLKVVTEGVETEDQLEIIREHQCDAVQGYIFSPPVPAPKFVQLYMEHRSGGQAG
ncbi:EAL domain-containing protein [Paenibacillus sp. N4]|uniref:bifunctional diguanylate cyclase/phosphodiesterase n=1 Tax=Paenibacillus vietnamensis TaxID=2590547 RepID=UPI001CD168D8|nr:EAL domain-containing protein [Paenibacillus vietnamensis]MCA0756752.1 EAL domain-containing protein [Paenibacillus vietnamensis]